MKRNKKGIFSTQKNKYCVPFWRKHVQHSARTSERLWYAWGAEGWGGELQEPWWPTCRSPSRLFLTKAFLSILSPSPPSLPPFPPPGLRGCSRPPRRLQTDVLGRAEHALLDVTSSYRAVKEAKGLTALQRPQYKSQTMGFLMRLVPNPPPRIAPAQQDTAGSLSVYRHNICLFFFFFFLGGGARAAFPPVALVRIYLGGGERMLLFPHRALVRVKRGLVAPAGIKSPPLVAKRCKTPMM